MRNRMSFASIGSISRASSVCVRVALDRSGREWPNRRDAFSQVSLRMSSAGKCPIYRVHFRKAGVQHDVLNETAAEIVFLEVELKP